MIDGPCRRYMDYVYMTLTIVCTRDMLVYVMNGSPLCYFQEDIPWPLLFIWWIFPQRKQVTQTHNFNTMHRYKWIYCS